MSKTFIFLLATILCIICITTATRMISTSNDLDYHPDHDQLDAQVTFLNIHASPFNKYSKFVEFEVSDIPLDDEDGEFEFILDAEGFKPKKYYSATGWEEFKNSTGLWNQTHVDYLAKFDSAGKHSYFLIKFVKYAKDTNQYRRRIVLRIDFEEDEKIEEIKLKPTIRTIKGNKKTEGLQQTFKPRKALSKSLETPLKRIKGIDSQRNFNFTLQKTKSIISAASGVLIIDSYFKDDYQFMYRNESMTTAQCTLSTPQQAVNVTGAIRTIELFGIKKHYLELNMISAGTLIFPEESNVSIVCENVIVFAQHNILHYSEYWIVSNLGGDVSTNYIPGINRPDRWLALLLIGFIVFGIIFLIAIIGISVCCCKCYKCCCFRPKGNNPLNYHRM